MICKNCGKEINKIEVKPFYYVGINDCKCQEGIQMIVPDDAYTDFKDFKCPECHEYPLEHDPVMISKLVKVVLDTRSKL